MDLRSGECNVVCCPVNGSVYFVCCVFDSVCELFSETIRNMFGCVCYFVVECDGVVGGALLDRPCMVFHRMCVLCLCPSERLDWLLPNVCIFVCRKLSPDLGV